jgi:hypothetical protein
MAEIDVSEYQATLRAAWSEAEFTKAVVDLFRSYGWLVHHTRPARSAKGWRTPVMGDVGFPDVVLTSSRRLCFAELKVKKGKRSPEQLKWAAKLLLACQIKPTFVIGFDYFVWKPNVWTEIEAYAKEWGTCQTSPTCSPKK